MHPYGVLQAEEGPGRGAVIEDGHESRLETEFSPNFSDFSGLFMASAVAAW